MKRVFDIVLALVLLPLAVMLCLPAAFLIRLDSSGNPVFLQVRVGRHQQPFTLLKMRTMAKGTRNAGSHEVGEAQITRIGRILRKTKIDELPQVWNVLLGQMSFVGPRPCLPNQTILVAERAARMVFDVRPGVTGRAQVKGIDMSTPKLLAEEDALYIDTWSFAEDMRLLLQTARGSGQGDAAAR